eukprot:scpid106174/ scgid35075/ 
MKRNKKKREQTNKKERKGGAEKQQYLIGNLSVGLSVEGWRHDHLLNQQYQRQQEAVSTAVSQFKYSGSAVSTTVSQLPQGSAVSGPPRQRERHTQRTWRHDRGPFEGPEWPAHPPWNSEQNGQCREPAVRTVAP